MKKQLDDVGFEVELDPKPAQGYYSYIGDIKNKTNLMTAGWAPDWPDGGATFNPLLSSATAGTSQNVADNKDPELDAKSAEISAMPYGDARAERLGRPARPATPPTRPPGSCERTAKELNLLSEPVKGFCLRRRFISSTWRVSTSQE